MKERQTAQWRLYLLYWILRTDMHATQHTRHCASYYEVIFWMLCHVVRVKGAMVLWTLTMYASMKKAVKSVCWKTRESLRLATRKQCISSDWLMFVDLWFWGKSDSCYVWNKLPTVTFVQKITLSLHLLTHTILRCACMKHRTSWHPVQMLQ